MAEKKKNPMKVVTPKFRLSFPDLFTARAYEDQEAKFSIQMLFDKKTDLTPLKNVMAKAIKEKWGDNPPKGIVKPFKDGNDKELDGYEDMIVVGASSKYKPQVCDKNPEELITSPEDIYAGCYARAAIIANAWEHKNKKGQVLKRGVSFRLESVQKMAEGESFVSRPDVGDTFDNIDDGSGDDENYEKSGDDDNLDDFMDDDLG